MAVVARNPPPADGDFGLTVLTMAFAVGHISGGHFNPAVTVGLWLGKRFDSKDPLEQLWLFIVAPLVGGVLGALAYTRS